LSHSYHITNKLTLSLRALDDLAKQNEKTNLGPFSAYAILAKVASFPKKEHEPLCMMGHFWFITSFPFSRYVSKIKSISKPGNVCLYRADFGRSG
jgi:hypothetical protein